MKLSIKPNNMTNCKPKKRTDIHHIILLKYLQTFIFEFVFLLAL